MNKYCSVIITRTFIQTLFKTPHLFTSFPFNHFIFHYRNGSNNIVINNGEYKNSEELGDGKEDRERQK